MMCVILMLSEEDGFSHSSFRFTSIFGSWTHFNAICLNRDVLMFLQLRQRHSGRKYREGMARSDLSQDSGCFWLWLVKFRRTSDEYRNGRPNALLLSFNEEFH